ncbi:zinc ribbon domain-containing protein, partial [Myxococcota bacterium]|nr:zinc ribbon domain-containing protein [Myxococcota bacterium]
TDPRAADPHASSRAVAPPSAQRPSAPVAARAGAFAREPEPEVLDFSHLADVEPLDASALEALDDAALEAIEPLDASALESLDAATLDAYGAADDPLLAPPIELGLEHVVTDGAAALDPDAILDPGDALDPDAILDPGDALDPDAILDPGDALDPDAILDPGEALDPDALADVDPEALYAEALGEPARPAPRAAAPRAAPVDTSIYGGSVDEAPIDDTPLMEGFENTRLDDEVAVGRRKRKGAPEPAAASGVSSTFAFQACPSCQAPQPDPNPSFCEACGTRLKKLSKKATEAELGAKRCIECGYRNKAEHTNCGNCGTRLRSSS